MCERKGEAHYEKGGGRWRNKEMPPRLPRRSMFHKAALFHPMEKGRKVEGVSCLNVADGSKTLIAEEFQVLIDETATWDDTLNLFPGKAGFIIVRWEASTHWDSLRNE